MDGKIYKVTFNLSLTDDEILVMVLAAMRVSGMQYARKINLKKQKKKKIVPKSG